MRWALGLVLLMTLLLIVVGIVVFHVSLKLDWIDAVYFVVVTITTVGYGDISLRDASPAVKLFGGFLMVAGAASMAAAVGIITDVLLRVRLEEYLGIRRGRMQDHVVLCGLGNVGFRVLEHLHRLGEQVVVVDRDEENRFLPLARDLKVPIVTGDIRRPAVLEQAGLSRARCLIAATDDDLANLDAALTAREMRKDIRVVMRMFDQDMASKMQTSFGIDAAFSASALAAPAIAMSALDSAVIGCSYVGEDIIVNAQIQIQPGTSLAGMTTTELEQHGHVRVLGHTGSATGRRQVYPAEPLSLSPGDILVVSTVPDFLRQLHQWNTPADD